MKRLGSLLERVPITIKVPVVVAVLMVMVGAVASERVVSRLVTTQERQIKDMTNAYLDGLASSLIDPVLRGDPWEIFDILDQAGQLDAAVRPVETVVTDSIGLVLAGSDPRHAPIGSDLPAEFPVDKEHIAQVLIREADSRAFVDRGLVVEGRAIGTLHAEFDISQLLTERREVVWTLLSTNTALTLIFAALGWFAVHKMVRPTKLLSDHLAQAAHGAVKPIPEDQLPSPDSEAGRLFRRFNQMARTVTENAALAARLAEEERLGSLGRLTSGMAHEINNPLGGLFNAIDTLKKHGDKPVVRASSLALIERGLFGIRDVVQAALATYRAKDSGRLLSLQDLEDVRLLIGPEIRRRRQTLDWAIDADFLPSLPSSLVRQAVLNILLNASSASGEEGRLLFHVTAGTDALTIEVGDSGPGLPPHCVAVLTGDQTAALRTGRGLGLWMVRRFVDEIGGRIDVGISSLGGAEIRLRLVAFAVEVQPDAA